MKNAHPITAFDLRRARFAVRAEAALSRPEDPIAPAHPNDAQAGMVFIRAARLNSVANFVAAKLRDETKRLEVVLASELRKHAPDAGSLPSIFQQFDRVVGEHFDRMARLAEDDLAEIGDACASQGTRALANHFRADAANPQATSIGALVLGAPLADHFDKMRSDLVFRLRAAVRAGVDNGDDGEALARRVLGQAPAVKARSIFDDRKVTAAAPKFGCLMAMLPSLDSTLPNWAADNIKGDTLVEDGIETEPHATVLYGFASDFNSDRLRDVLANVGPFEVVLSKLDRFACDGYDVIKFTVDSPGLVALNRKLAAAFSEDVTMSKWSYKPHVTVAYVAKGSNSSLDGSAIEGKKILVSQLLYSLPGKAGRKVFTLGKQVRAGDVPGHEFHGNQFTSALYVKQGKTLTPVTPQQASRMASALRWQAMEEGVRPDDVAMPRLHDSEGREVAHVSWNGKVWHNDHPKTPIYSPTDEDMEHGRSGKHPNAIDAHDRWHVRAAAGPATVLVRLLDTTDNSVAKVVKAAATAFAKAADESLLDAVPDDSGPARMGFVWVSAQDGNVCPFCEFYDGNMYDEDKEPVAGAPELETEPPAHFGCRCALVPCDLDAPAPRGGFNDYLDQFSDEEQREAFGDAPLEAWRRGEIGPGALMNQQDHSMSLEQFKSGEPELRFDLDKYERMGAESAAGANARTAARRGA